MSIDQLTADACRAVLPKESFDVKDPGDDSQWRSVTGFVDRRLPAAMLADERGSRPVIQVAVPNDATDGVLATFDRVNTLFAVSIRDGGAVDHDAPLKCSRILNQDDAEVLLELR